MNDVNNRKLFRKSQSARNKLREIGGIMASDAELMQTVAKYQVGGPVLGGNLPQRPVTTYSGTAQQFRMLPRAVQQQVLDAENTQRGIAGALSQAGKFASIPIELGYGAVTGAYDLARRGLQGVGLADPSVQAEAPELGLFGMFDEMQQKGAPLQNVDELQGMLAMQQGEVDPAIARAVEQQKADQAARAESDALGQSLGDYSFSEDQPFMMPGVTPSTMPEEQKKVIKPEEPAVVKGDGAARDEGRAPMAATDPQITAAAKRGELGAAEQVKAVVQQGTPKEQEQSLATLMNEFKQNAPEYKGIDRGLAIAKIGFAMAAGQSPNAITNIAKAMSDGADTLIKDKRDREAFDRQVQLSALQYGLGEIGKKRAQDRLDQRTFKEFVAGKDGIEYNGETYSEGETILISQEDIIANGGKIPKGLEDKAVYAAGIKAASERLKAITDAADEIRKEKVIKDTVLDSRLETYKKATNTVISAEAGIQLTENAILDVAEGRVTGISNALGDLMNRTANSIGVDLGKNYESVADFRKDIRQVFQEMIPVTLGEAQSANSISNRDVEFLADAFITAGALRDGAFDLTFVDQDILVGQLQGAIRKMRQAQAGAISEMTSIEGRLLGRTVSGGGQASEYIQPYRETVEPYLPTETGQRGGDITSTLGMTSIGTDDQGRRIYDLTGGQ